MEESRFSCIGETLAEEFPAILFRVANTYGLQAVEAFGNYLKDFAETIRTQTVQSLPFLPRRMHVVTLLLDNDKDTVISSPSTDILRQNLCKPLFEALGENIVSPASEYVWSTEIHYTEKEHREFLAVCLRIIDEDIGRLRRAMKNMNRAWNFVSRHSELFFEKLLRSDCDLAEVMRAESALRSVMEDTSEVTRMNFVTFTLTTKATGPILGALGRLQNASAASIGQRFGRLSKESMERLERMKNTLPSAVSLDGRTADSRAIFQLLELRQGEQSLNKLHNTLELAKRWASDHCTDLPWLPAVEAEIQTVAEDIALAVPVKVRDLRRFLILLQHI